MTHTNIISNDLGEKSSRRVVVPLHESPVPLTVAGRQPLRGLHDMRAKPVIYGTPDPDWLAPVELALARRYETQGWRRRMLVDDLGLLRRACGPKHPSEVTLADLENVVLAAKKASSRHTYVSRFHSIFDSLRLLGIIDENHRPDAGLPRLRRPRSVPRPISKAQAEMLMNHTADPMVRQFFVLGCLAGMRAFEVSAIEGTWLEEHDEGPVLRILGKGRTDLTIPAHPRVAELVRSHRTFGRLFKVGPQRVSVLASAAMREIGITNNSFHACRHFFCTALYEASNDLLLVSEMARHADLATTRGYTRLRHGQKREVLNTLFAEGGESAHEGLASA